ncbi:formate transporter [Bordetella genomosp. 1]|uniref:Formate transporter n=1 Tax=Bordetella genomosp. 1 TaxID=1395607 RepID=A0A261RT82_9BORD|nr:formate/nitrite transporter family protein [Bordetella genomosp. 1]MDQ8031804.1 formate/nitrite transporter family protein [Bordetella sp.]OZI28276.1 formate transporter [Bordetella genomosp. 1]OZI68368.1 formate transporter [Bordetella genomosp. 1]
MSDNGTTNEKKESAEELTEKLPSKAAAVHEIIRKEGEKEMRRDFFALFWSAIAGGLIMSTSMLGRGVLQAYLPDAQWAILVEAMGYTLGFIFVITAGQQLFTENTVTPVLPFMSQPTWRKLMQLMRLWGTVLLGNFIGGLIAAAVFAYLPMFSPEVDKEFLEMGHHLLQVPNGQSFATAVLAGWLIALLVWMIHAVETGRILLIFLITYLMGISDVAHVVVGTIEVTYLVLLGQAAISDGLLNFVLPTLVGNIIGGTFIFALISHAQVRADAGLDVPDDEEPGKGRAIAREQDAAR